ncbi:MAG: hypothetical protein WAK93_15290, partial [Solirubrobacteraceae bacterium]
RWRVRRPALRPALDEVVIVIAGDDHDFAAGAEGRPDLLQWPRRRSQRLADRAMAKLEHVAEQHQAIDIGQRARQRAPGFGLAQDVPTGARPQVQIGNDQRSQPGPQSDEVRGDA